MSLIYIDPSSSTHGTGSRANPYNSFTDVATAAGDTVLLKSDTRFAGRVPPAVLAPGSITLGMYGSGRRPVIDGGIAVSMRPTAIAGVFEFPLFSNVGGNLQIDGAPQRWTAWNNDLNTTAAAMPPGSFTYDPTTFTYYAKPLGGSLTGSEVRVSSVINAISGYDADSNTVCDLEIRQPSKHAVVHVNASRFSVINVDARHCGGYYDLGAGFYSGNGFEIGESSSEALVERCRAFDIFDSAFTAQIYAGRQGTKLSRDHVFTRCESYRCGFSAYEFSVLGRGQTLRNVHLNAPVAVDSGTGVAWAIRPRQGNALSVISGAGASGGVEGVVCDSPHFERSLYGVSSLHNANPVVVSGQGLITGNQIARVRVVSSGRPAADIVVLSADIGTDGIDDLGGHPDALRIS